MKPPDVARPSAEEEFAHPLATLRAMLESTTDGVVVTGGAGEVTDFNDKFVKMWQIPDDIMDSKDHRRLLGFICQHFEDPWRFIARIDEICARALAESHDLLELVDGRTFERFSRIQVVHGQNVGHVWIFREITAQTHAEEALQRAIEARFRLSDIVESSFDAIISKDLDGNIVSWNPAAELLYGYTAEEVIGKSVSLLLPPERYNELPGIMERLKRGERIDHFETVRVRKDGRRLDVSLTISPVKTADGKIIGASKIARDITANKRAEREKTSLLAALEEADRRKDEFLATLAHELRNPLAPIRNAVQIFRAMRPSEPELQSATEVIDRQVHQMTRLVDDLLDTSRCTTGKIELRKERVELAAIMKTAVEASRPLIEKRGHELTVTIPPEPIHLEADLIRLAQALSNLLNNAAKYTKQGGRISLIAERQKDHVLIRVKDSGIGIPAEMLSHVFDMFAQVDHTLERSQGGLGIGLTLVKRLVELHRGTVEACSAGAGQGSEFIVHLPVAVEARSQGPQRAAGDSETHALPAMRSILVVDDNRDSADTLALVLRMEGHVVHTAYDGLEAVEAAAMFRPDVVLLDIGLPKLNGYDAALRIRALECGRGMMLVALTGWGQEEDRRRSREAGFDHHMTKPVDLPALQRLLAKIEPSR